MADSGVFCFKLLQIFKKKKQNPGDFIQNSEFLGSLKYSAETELWLSPLDGPSPGQGSPQPASLLWVTASPCRHLSLVLRI